MFLQNTTWFFYNQLIINKLYFSLRVLFGSKLSFQNLGGFVSYWHNFRVWAFGGFSLIPEKNHHLSQSKSQA